MNAVHLEISLLLLIKIMRVVFLLLSGVTRPHDVLGLLTTIVITEVNWFIDIPIVGHQSIIHTYIHR